PAQSGGHRAGCAAPDRDRRDPGEGRAAARACEPPRPRQGRSGALDDAARCLRLLSGRNHRVYTGVCLVTPKETFRQRLVETRLRFKRLASDELEAYLASGEWRGKAGGYAVQGLAGTFVVKMVGSYSNVVGLPLYETMSLLGGEGYPVHFGWLNAV